MSEIGDRFATVVPNGEQAAVLEVTRDVIALVAERLERLLPDGREKALAMTKLEEAAMWASKAVVRG